MEGRNFFFDCFNFMYYKCHKINLKHGASYIYSPNQTKIKKAIINLNNNNDKSFQYAATAALNLENIGKKLKNMSKTKPFIDKYNWRGII